MQISQPQVVAKKDAVECQFDVRFKGEQKTLWYRLDESYSSFMSERSDAALVALLIPAMESGEDVYVEGAISEQLYYACSRPYQHVLRAIMPDKLQLVDIHAADIQSASESASGVATGFSAGIDSFCVLADHYYSSDVPDGFRVTHLLYNNVGSHGSGGEQLFRERYARIRPVADRIGLPFLAVNTNVSAFYDHRVLSFPKTHTPRNASVALLLQKGIGRFLYASAYSYDDVSVSPNYGMGSSDPIALPLLSTGAFDAFSTGSEYTRVEKTLKVTELEDSYSHLDVCVRSETAGNCSTCWKCMRTQFTLEIAGLLDRYETAFDLGAYRAHRDLNIARLFLRDGPLSREVIAFAEECGFEVPSKVYGYMILLKILRKVRRLKP